MDLDNASRSRPNTWPLKTKSARSASFFGVSSICLVLAALLAACSPSASGHLPNSVAQQTSVTGSPSGPLHADGAHLVDAQGNRLVENLSLGTVGAGISVAENLLYNREFQNDTLLVRPPEPTRVQYFVRALSPAGTKYCTRVGSGGRTSRLSF